MHFCAFQGVDCQFEQVFFNQRFAYVAALRPDKGKHHAASDNEVIHLIQQMVDDLYFAGNLGAAEYCRKRFFAFSQHFIETPDFSIHQVTE
ncbi:hypothetical protein DSECCO2_357110 [anaerobic digester metagenome]